MKYENEFRLEVARYYRKIGDAMAERTLRAW